jgi:hypothetical protein
MAPHENGVREKKRKRQENDAHRPSKKAATTGKAGTVKVELLKGGNAPGPILGIRNRIIPELE